MSKLTEFLGTTRPVLRGGFTKNERAGAMPTCQVCGALVTYETQELHLQWHASHETAALKANVRPGR